MTPEKQRIAIAEACGWKPDGYEHWKNPTRNCHEDFDGLPDYLNDLNAMHEAEKTLPRGMAATYGYHIMDRLESDTPESKRGFEHVQAFLWHATAAQRAEAFLRTIGKWEEL